MLSLLAYQAEGQAVFDVPTVVAALAADGRVRFDGAPGDAYRPGMWRDPETRAHADIDCGAPPLVDDEDAEQAYPGWQPAGWAVHLPLAGPHWYVAEITAWLAATVATLPGTGFLISEDVGVEDEPGYGPGQLDRPRVVACWERCVTGQRQGLTVPQMDRAASLQLWRYRRERARGAATHPGRRWPEALVLADGDRARSACIWPDPAIDWALPPVELVVVPRIDGAGALPADEVLAAAGGGVGLDAGGAHGISGGGPLMDLWQRARLQPRARYASLGDHDWAD